MGRHRLKLASRLDATISSWPGPYSSSLEEPFRRALTAHAPKHRHALILSASLDEHGRVPVATTLRSLERLVELAGNPDLGLHAGREVCVGTFGAFGYAVSAADTVQHAVATAQRYRGLVGGALSPSLKAQGTRVLLQLDDPRVPSTRTIGDFLIAAWYENHLASQVHAALIEEVWLAHSEPSATGAYETSFPGIQLRFNAACYGFLLRAEAADALLPGRNQQLYPMLCTQAAMACDRLRSLDDTASRVRELLYAQLQLPSPDATRAARISRALGISTRTLCRRLRDEGTSFAAECALMRCRLAREYLRHGQLEVREISRLLGYSQAQAFNRAFKLWMGETPCTYRARHVQLQAGSGLGGHT